MAKKVNDLSPILSKDKIDTPEEFWNNNASFFEDFPFALCALDEAYHDWYAKQLNVPLYKYWGLNHAKQPQQCYTLSIDNPEVIIERMKAKPWPIYKIKLGTDNDIDLVEKIRQATNSKFWVDANCSWNVDDSIRKSIELKKLGVELIEQPLPSNQWDEMEEVFHKSVVPLIADESCKTQKDISKCVDRFHGINIKVMKCGGLTPALKMIHEARQKNLKVMVGCMAESTVGISAIAHLSSLVDYADMDGQHFIKNDPASGVMVTKNGIQFSSIMGSGVILHRPGLLTK